MPAATTTTLLFSSATLLLLLSLSRPTSVCGAPRRSSRPEAFALNVTLIKRQNNLTATLTPEFGPKRGIGEMAKKVRKAIRPVLSLWFRAENLGKFEQVRLLLTCNGTNAALHMYSPSRLPALSIDARNGSGRLVVRSFSRRQCMREVLELIAGEVNGPLRALFRETCEVYGQFDDPRSSAPNKDRGTSNSPHDLWIVLATFAICLTAAFLVCVWAVAKEVRRRMTENRDEKARKAERDQKKPEPRKTKDETSPPRKGDSSTTASTCSLLRETS